MTLQKQVRRRTGVNAQYTGRRDECTSLGKRSALDRPRTCCISAGRVSGCRRPSVAGSGPGVGWGDQGRGRRTLISGAGS
mmetsp:Transcript_16420/g.44629  ORF Transcript_16420/g.44629 Transcript_16420/m.44629 type:complete len:80 (+) Transcript_16420:273-512(+)